MAEAVERPSSLRLGPEEFLGLSPAERIRLIRAPNLAPLCMATGCKLLVMLGRPRTCIPGLIAYILGFSYTGADATPKLLLGGLLALLIGFSANLHNTYTDLEEDARNLPGRGWMLSLFGMRRLLWALIAVNLFMFASSAVFGAEFFVLMTLALIGIHQYSFPPLRLKARPVFGLYQFAQAVVFPFFFGWLTTGTVREFVQNEEALAMGGFLLLWFVAKGMFKNVPDFYGDRSAGIRTSATVFGSWRAAAVACMVATIAAYLSLAVIAALGLVTPWTLLALLWLPVVAVQCTRLVRADDGVRGNEILRVDMLVSSAFLATLLLLAAPRWESVAVVVTGALILGGTDLLKLDSRRSKDSPVVVAGRETGQQGGA